MTLFTLAAKLGLDTSEYEKSVKGAVSSGKNLGDKLTSTFNTIKKAAAAVISVAVIKKGIDSVINLANEIAAAGDAIDKQSQALGLSRKAYQEWDYILSQNGASINSLGVSMKTLNSAILSAAEGGEEAKSAFAKLGLGIHEIENLNMEDQFEAVVRAFQRMPAGAKKSALAVQLFGRNGMELLPLLNSSSTSIDELRQAAEDLGIIMSDDAVDASVEYTNAIDTMKRSFNALKYNIGSQLLPVMTNGMTKLANYAGKLSKAYGQGGFSAVASTIAQDIKNINWPTWSDVEKAATKAWNTVVDGAKGLAKVVFGENVDGTIAWPTWDDVKDTAIAVWNGIKEGAANIADEAGALVFGRSEDGTVAWPDPETLGADAKTWWESEGREAVEANTRWTLSLFDMPTEDTDTIAKNISSWWENQISALDNVLQWSLNAPDTPSYESGLALHDAIVEWWNGYVNPIKNILGTMFDNVDGEGFADSIKNWWDNTVLPELQSELRFTAGLFGLPDPDEMTKAIKEWWQGVLAPVEGFLAQYGITLGNKEGSGKLEQEQIEYLRDMYKPNMNEDEQIEYTSLLRSHLESAGVSANDVENAINNIDWTQSRDEMDEWLSSLTTTKTEAESLGEVVSSVAGDYDIDYHINTYGEIPSVGSFGGGTSTGNGAGRKFAKGLWDVPYDDYPAQLHRGEMVLNASRARDYREGNAGGGIDMSALSSVVESAIRAGMQGATVKSYLSGKDITDDVNRNTVRQLKARRFAT